MLPAQHAASRPPSMAVTVRSPATPAACQARRRAEPDRRRALLSLLGATAAVTAQQLGAGQPALAADESLCGRLDAPAAVIRNPGGARPWAEKQIHYPVDAAAHGTVRSQCDRSCLPLRLSLTVLYRSGCLASGPCSSGSLGSGPLLGTSTFRSGLSSPRRYGCVPLSQHASPLRPRDYLPTTSDRPL